MKKILQIILAGSILLLVVFGSGNSSAQFGVDAHTLVFFNFDTPDGKKVKNEALDTKLDGELFGYAKVIQGAGKQGGGLVLY